MAAVVLVGVRSSLALLVSLAGVGVALLARGRWRDVALAATAVALVGASCAWRLAAREASPIAQWAELRAGVAVEARVIGDPRRFSRFGDQSAAVRIVALRVTRAQESVAGNQPLVAFVRDDAHDLWAGQRVTLLGRLEPSRDGDAAAVLVVVRRGPGRDAAWWWRAANRVRMGIRHAVSDVPPGPRALVPALVDGDDGDIPDAVAEEFRRSGLTHLMAVSGTNLTIVVATVLALAGAAGVRRRVRIGIVVIATAGFVLVARPEPSVVRAAAMGLVGVAARPVGGRGAGRILAVAVVGLLFLDPWMSRRPGFVLSVAATAGIVFFAPAFAVRFARWMPLWCGVVLAVPLAAQLACTPIIAVLSQQVSIVAVFANVVAAPLVAPATVLGLAAGFVDLISAPLGRVLGSLAGWFAAGILAVAHRGASFSGAAADWHGPGWLLALSTVAVAFGLWRGARHPPVILGIALGVSLAMVRPPHAGWPPRGWVMVACDVGQGDATVVNAGAGSALLIDAGPNALAVDLCLRRLHVRHLSAVVITHAHADHIDGWPGAAHGRSVGPIFGGPSGAGRRLLAAGDRLTVGGIRARVLWPPAGSAVPDRDDGTAMNNSSVVMRVRVRGLRLMLAGDVETEAQDQILASGVALAADVLKFPHHGSSRQAPGFLAAVHPRISTISVGKDNDYGHPSPQALAMLRSIGGDWRRTDVDGDIAIVRHDGRLVVATRR